MELNSILVAKYTGSTHSGIADEMRLLLRLKKVPRKDLICLFACNEKINMFLNRLTEFKVSASGRKQLCLA